MRERSLRARASLAQSCLAVLAALLLSSTLHAYSVLTHEAIIDTAWEHELKALLLKRFPGTTSEQLLRAHGYAYAGAIIQDAGYYLFGIGEPVRIVVRPLPPTEARIVTWYHRSLPILG